jgi:HSP90 family molecular chaperone
MKFEADPRLLELLVGSNLYPAPDVCVRELVQNAWDAVEWRRSLGDGGGGQIQVRFHASEGWFEVQDDGIGMDEQDIESSFLKVGRDKLEALGAPEAGEQVAFFGIGILSVFLVADMVDVSTKKRDAVRGVRISIKGLQSQIETAPDDGASVGTSVRRWASDQSRSQTGRLHHL